MPRIARKDLNTPYLHVMIQGVNKEYVFNNNYYKEVYLKTIDVHKSDYNLEILAYCMMNNHAHFAFYVEDKVELAKLMHKVNTKYAKMYNEKNNRCGVLFRNRYQIEPIYNVKHLVNCINYIHQNPVKAGIVSKCEDYKYSSFKDYQTNKGLAKSRVLANVFGGNCDYMKLFAKECGKIFIDVDKPNKSTIDSHILSGMVEFKTEYKDSLADIFSDRRELERLFKYLKVVCGIKYADIGRFFDINKSTLNRIKQG
ncbi:MAG: transposase [Clostridia bacterium]|nr:transposase [Clostridia bacterium]